MRTATRSALIAGALLFGACTLSACSKSGPGRPLSVAPTTPPTTLPTSITTVPPTTTTAPAPSSPQPSQDQAAAHLIAAWQGGNRGAALAVARPTAVDAVFAQPYPKSGVQARGCSEPVAATSACDYRLLPAGSLLKLSAVQIARGWVVDTVIFEG
jgi:hypothetical protein